MEIGSSIEGMMKAQRQLEQSAQNIAEKPLQNRDITADIVDQKESKYSFQMNARVAKVQDEMLGETIDLLA